MGLTWLTRYYLFTWWYFLTGMKWGSGCLQRTVQGLAGVLFSLQLLPTIRYQNNSEMARSLAENIRVSLFILIILFI